MFPPQMMVSGSALVLGGLYTWGAFGSGQLGHGGSTGLSSPVQIGSSADWTNFQWGKMGPVAGNRGASVNSAGKLFVMGENGAGSLGLGDLTDRSSPVQVGALTTWAMVSCGGYSMLAVKTDGTLWAWGDNTYDQLGTSNNTNYSSPVQVGALTNWSKVASGYTHALSIKSDGTLWAWGLNAHGELGTSNTTPTTSPVQVGALTDWAQVDVTGSSTNTGESSAGIRTGGTLWTWGLNSSGQLGDGSTTNRSSPVQVGALTTWALVSMGGDVGKATAAAIKTDGTLWMWGDNTSGQLGQGNTTATSSPVQVGALTNWSKVSVGAGPSGHVHVLALKTDGTLWAWGYGVNGQLGDGTIVSKSSPVQIGALTTWKGISAGYLMGTGKI